MTERQADHLFYWIMGSIGVGAILDLFISGNWRVLLFWIAWVAR